MGVVMQGGGGKPTIWFQRVSLTGQYLRYSVKAAQCAITIPDSTEHIDERFEQTVLTILWAALALESGANEFAEDIIPAGDLDHFDRCTKTYQKPKSISQTLWKWICLFKYGPKIQIPLTETFIVEAESLIQLRHQLVHYKPQESARKVYYDVQPPQRQADGTYHGVMWDAAMVPSKVEPSLVESTLFKKSASKYYMTAREVFRQWELKNGRDVSELEKAFPRL